MPHSVASDLDLHCLPMSHKRMLGLYGLSEMIAKLERTLSILYTKQGPNINSPQTMEATINNELTTTDPPPHKDGQQPKHLN